MSTAAVSVSPPWAEPQHLRALPSLPKAPTGIAGLDEVTAGGLPRGRATLVCGPAGCGKTLLGMEFLVRGITEYGEPGVFLAFEETTDDLIANVASLGFDLAQLQTDGLLVLDHVNLVSADMDETGEWDLEALLLRLGSAIDEIGAKRVVLDTLENLFGGFSDTATVRSELRRLLAWLKTRGVTAVVTGERGEGTLTRHSGSEVDGSDQQIASLIDTWLVAKIIEGNGERNRALYILKSRGMAHSNQIREFRITDEGVEFADVYVGPEHVLTGSARAAQEADERLKATARTQDLEQRKLNLERRRMSVEAQAAIMWREFEAEADVVDRLLRQGSTAGVERAEQRVEQGRLRSADTVRLDGADATETGS